MSVFCLLQNVYEVIRICCAEIVDRFEGNNFR